jgi:hypothetical protein
MSAKLITVHSLIAVPQLAYPIIWNRRPERRRVPARFIQRETRVEGPFVLLFLSLSEIDK